MISYHSYSDQALRNALIKLKERPTASDIMLIEQVEREIRRRGKDPRNSYYGKDVLGVMVKEMVKAQAKSMAKAKVLK